MLKKKSKNSKESFDKENEKLHTQHCTITIINTS